MFLGINVLMLIVNYIQFFLSNTINMYFYNQLSKWFIWS